jgi:hypothetical protein
MFPLIFNFPLTKASCGFSFPMACESQTRQQITNFVLFTPTRVPTKCKLKNLCTDHVNHISVVDGNGCVCLGAALRRSSINFTTFQISGCTQGGNKTNVSITIIIPFREYNANYSVNSLQTATGFPFFVML